MSATRSAPDDALLAEAASWFARLRNESADADDWLAFDRWLGGAPERLQAYEQVEQAWIEIEDAPLPQPLTGRAPFSRSAVAPSRRVWWGAAAALAASAAVAAYVSPLVRGPEGPAVTYSAPVGAARSVRLADGTQLLLRPGSSLTVRLGRRSRQVVMADAEAVFDVAHDAKRPFLIAAGDTTVRVVGTQFDLRRRSGQLLLSVSRGVVEVRAGQAGAATRVAAGQRLQHAEGSAEVAVDPAQPEADFAWTHRRLIYRNDRLDAVAADLSRDLGVPVRVADNATAARRFGGVLNLDAPDVVLQRLSALADVRVEKDAGGYVLSRR